MIGVAEHWEVATPRSDHSRCAQQWADIDDFHRRKGYSMVAYNHGACIHGGKFVGRGWGVPSAANGTRWSNLNFWAICAMTGPGQAHTPELRAALDDLTAEGLRRSEAPDEVSPHSRFFNTACPGDTIRGWIVQGLGREGDDDMPLTEKEKLEIAAYTQKAVNQLLDPRLDSIDKVLAELKAKPPGSGATEAQIKAQIDKALEPFKTLLPGK